MQIPIELAKLLNDEDFDRMCIEVYKVVFNDPIPAKNGRRGQAQAGADSYIYSTAEGRIAVQSKRYNQGGLTEKDITDEVAKSDAGETSIVKLLIATTASADAPLRQFVNSLSDERAAQGLFEVAIDFWPEVTGHIRRHASLQEQFEPHAPGAVFHRMETALAESGARAEERHRQIIDRMQSLHELVERGGLDKSKLTEPNQSSVSLPAKFVTTRSGLIYLTLDQLAISMVERMRNTTFERRVTLKTEQGELFVDALQQDDDLPADHILEVRWLRKRYLDAPIWVEQIVSKFELCELLTGRKASGTLVFVVPNRLRTLDDLPLRQAAALSTGCTNNSCHGPIL